MLLPFDHAREPRYDRARVGTGLLGRHPAPLSPPEKTILAIQRRFFGNGRYRTNSEGVRSVTETMETVKKGWHDPRLKQLLAGLTAVRDGDFGTRLPLAGDELTDEIARVFNGMV